jgi:O-antigen/teichoic acid export membrane protein
VVMAIIGPWILPIWGQEFIAAYPVLLILMVGYSISNIFFWNRSLLLSFGKANIPLYIITGAAIAKIALAFVFVPVYGMNAEALLLSGNFVVSVGLLVWIGLAMIRRVEKKDLTENRLTS